MALSNTDWFDTFKVEWGEDGLEFLSDYAWRLKIEPGGVLIFQQKQAGGSIRVAAPHTWKTIQVRQGSQVEQRSGSWLRGSTQSRA